MLDQLFNNNLLRLWRTGAGTEQYMSKEDEDIDISMYYIDSSSMHHIHRSNIHVHSWLFLILAQLSYLFEEDDDYTLSKNVDIALWQDYRAHLNTQPMRDALDFVIVNDKLHEEFDELKRGLRLNLFTVICGRMSC